MHYKCSSNCCVLALNLYILYNNATNQRMELHMAYLEKAHLYIEKYNRATRELLLDFVKEDEFRCFTSFGEAPSNMHFSVECYEPTMLLIHDCAPKRTIPQKSIITVEMDQLIAVCNERRLTLDNQMQELPATVFLEILDGSEFAALLENTDICSISRYISAEFVSHPSGISSFPPCALESMSDSFELRIWNVGQGNTNSIFDGENLVLFDFGASMYHPKQTIEDILSAHDDLLCSASTISLIISHWDIDHYKLLCYAGSTFLQRISCAFYPSTGIIGTTAKQALARIEYFCQSKNAINPVQKKAPYKEGIQKLFNNSTFTLFTGEKSRSKNWSGLLLSVHSKTATAFLTADHSNYQVWDEMYTYVGKINNTLHIVVPHHGGYCGNVPIKSGVLSGKAVISVGKNGYKHPSLKTISAYVDAGYTVLQTDRQGNDIIINM